jgi:cobalt-precorrin 5A hydrolase
MVGDQAMTPNVAIGVGCRLDCPAEAIESLVRQALERVPDATPRGLFTIADKREEPGLAEAAKRLGLDLVFFPPDALREQEASVRTLSPASARRFGVPSVAEAAALAGAGPGAVLLIARMVRGAATCAIAVSPEGPA